MRQARTEEWMEATNTTTSEEREILCGHNSAQQSHHSPHQHQQQQHPADAGFLQQVLIFYLVWYEKCVFVTLCSLNG